MVALNVTKGATVPSPSLRRRRRILADFLASFPVPFSVKVYTKPFTMFFTRKLP